MNRVKYPNGFWHYFFCIGKCIKIEYIDEANKR